MANTLTAYIPTIIARTIPILRETLRIQRYVTTNYDSEMEAVGASLQIPVTAQLTTTPITPSSTAPALTSLSPSSVTLTLNNFQSAKMSVTSSDLNTMMRNTDFVPAHLQEGARSLARSIIDTVWQNTANVPYFTGTPATNPFATSLSTLANARLSLNNTLADTEGRVMLISNTADQGANSLGNLIQAYQRGSAETLNTGELGELEGFMMVRDSRVPTHTAGTGSGYVTNGATAVGATAVVLKTGTGTVLVGDIVTFTGDTQTYVVTTGVAAAGTINVYPPIQVASSDSTAMTIKATFVANLGMDRGAFALAMRQPRVAGNADGMNFMSMPQGQINVVIPFRDDQGPEATGMEFFLSMVPGYWAETLEVGALWGTTTLRPERAVIMAG